MKRFLLLYYCLLIFGCNKSEVQTIDLKNMVQKEIIHIAELKLIESYPNFQNCEGDTINANLYLCYFDDERDTVLVFEPCKNELFYFSNVQPTIIHEDDILSTKNGFVSVRIPNINLKNKKYVIGNLSYLSE